MSLIRVWNITDDSSKPDITPHNRMVLGKVVKPGRSVKVDAERLKLAHKVQREVKAGFLHIGDQPPTGYVRQKKPPRAVADARMVDGKGKMHGPKKDVGPGHGQVPADLIAKESGDAISKAAGEKKKKDEDEREAKRKKDEKPDEAEMNRTSDDAPAEEESGDTFFGGKKKTKRG